VVAAAFDGQSRVERQRTISALLREELAGPLHALSIRALTPREASSAI
jgi:BolA protein